MDTLPISPSFPDPCLGVGEPGCSFLFPQTCMRLALLRPGYDSSLQSPTTLVSICMALITFKINSLLPNDPSQCPSWTPDPRPFTLWEFQSNAYLREIPTLLPPTQVGGNETQSGQKEMMKDRNGWNQARQSTIKNATEIRKMMPPKYSVTLKNILVDSS